MRDVWADTLYRASYGGVEFDCLTTQDTVDRAVVMFSFPRRNGGIGQDLGAEPRVTDCRAIFFEREGATDHRKRFERWYRATQLGKAQEFIHPITGSYKAMAPAVTWSADGVARNVIMADVSFVETITEPGRLRIQAPVEAGLAAVEVEVAQVDAEFSLLGLISTIGAEALAAVELWESTPTLSVREVNLQVASLSARIDADIQVFALDATVERFSLWKALQRLNLKIIVAAEGFRQAQPQLVRVTLRTDLPLRVFCADQYGADEADARAVEINRLNDIEDPSSILAGTTLTIPAPSSSRQAALRRAA